MGRGDGDIEQALDPSYSSLLMPKIPEPLVDSKRPFISYRDGKLPVPWISWKQAMRYRNWLEFDDDVVDQIIDSDYQLCQICGEQLDQQKLFALSRKAPTEHGHTLTTGNGMHPRCALLAFYYCPYLRQLGEENAFRSYTGEDNGLHPDFKDQSSQLDLVDTPISEQCQPISVADIKALTRQRA